MILMSGVGIIELFTDKGSCWLGSEDVVKASVASTEEIRLETERYSSLGGGSSGLLEVHLKK